MALTEMKENFSKSQHAQTTQRQSSKESVKETPQQYIENSLAESSFEVFNPAAIQSTDSGSMPSTYENIVKVSVRADNPNEEEKL